MKINRSAFQVKNQGLGPVRQSYRCFCYERTRELILLFNSRLLRFQKFFLPERIVQMPRLHVLHVYQVLLDPFSVT
jgi:hypothetical protein